jgi:hypothetical protein
MADKFRECAVPGCNGNAHWTKSGSTIHCQKHKTRLSKYGSVDAVLRPSKGEPMRFYKEVVLKYDGDECLKWPYATGAGYGRIMIGSKLESVHRMACEEENGPPPTPEHEAAHSCGNGHLGCVTKRHLSWKTSAENQADRIVHGTDMRGERHVNAKLTEKEVREIIALKGKERQEDTAQRYGVKQAHISSIQVGRSWSWIDR